MRKKMRKNINKLDYEFKLKDDQINGIDFSKSKINSLNLERFL